MEVSAQFSGPVDLYLVSLEALRAGVSNPGYGPFIGKYSLLCGFMSLYCHSPGTQGLSTIEEARRAIYFSGWPWFSGLATLMALRLPGCSTKSEDGFLTMLWGVPEDQCKGHSPKF